MTDIYERELKGILSAEQRYMEKAARWSGDYVVLHSHPFLVVKAGGSFGIDLLATREFTVLPIEVKASASPIFRFSKNRKLARQAVSMVAACGRAKLVPVYAFRLKNTAGDPWRLFTIGTLENSFTRLLPGVETNKEGNMIMRWDKGLPLGAFLRQL